MISKLEVFGVAIESSILDLALAILTFAALALFFMAIVRRDRLKSSLFIAELNASSVSFLNIITLLRSFNIIKENDIDKNSKKIGSGRCL